MALSNYDVQLIKGLIQHKIDHHNHLILEQELYAFGDKATTRGIALKRDIENMKNTLASVIINSGQK